MEYTTLGQTGLLVSRLCLGCMTFGGEADEAAASSMIAAFVDAGGNFLDTADSYWAGESEEMVGRATTGIRDELVIATKVGLRIGPGANDVGTSRERIIRSCEASLRRLRTDRIDLYQLHCFDPSTPVEESMDALRVLVDQGKIRYAGLSNFTGWQVAEARLVAEAVGLRALASVQPQYSLVERNVEKDVIPVCERYGLGVIAWGPLGGGFLSGKYRRDEPPSSEGRLGKTLPWMEEHWPRRAVEQNWAVLAAVGDIARDLGKHPAQVALNWLLTRPAVTGPIVGARSPEQLEVNLGAVGWRLAAEQEELLTKLSAIEETYPERFVRVAMGSRLAPGSNFP